MNLPKKVFVALACVSWLTITLIPLGFGQENDNGRIELVTSAGKVVGLKRNTPWGNVVQFYGIPYAEPVKRFQLSSPLLGKGNKEKLKVSTLFEQSPPACIQTTHLPEFSHPSLPIGGARVCEDCLRLNVYQPAVMDAIKPLPVVLFVPGDGYGISDMTQYDGSALAAKGNIIVATVNYRVDVLGFASMGNSTLPGNAGLSDIASALRFMIHNAPAFNGDSENITIAGRFSGSMAISTLITTNLFYNDDKKQEPLAKRVILHGGVTTSQWTIDPNPLAAFEKLATVTGCNKGDGEHTLNCLQMLDSTELREKAAKMFYSWRPVIDGITVMKNPLAAIEFGDFSSDINFLIGDNSGSGSVCYITHKFLKSKYFEKFERDEMKEEDFVTLANENLYDFYKMEESSLGPLASHEYYYRQPQDETSSWRDSYFTFCGALYIRTPTELFARYSSRLNAPVYRYEFSYQSSSSIHPSYFHGALGDEILFVFPTENTKLDKKDEKIADLFLQSWANFIKSGNPSTPNNKWELFNEMQKNLAGFTKNGIEFSTTNNLDKDVHFWRDVFLPLANSFKNEPSFNKTCGSKLDTNTNNPNAQSSSVGYFKVFFIIVAIAGSLTLIIYFIRNQKRPYIWKS